MFWKSTRLGGLEGKINGVFGVDTALSGRLESIPIQSEILKVCLAMGKKPGIGRLVQLEALISV